jgi:hypothetical protein
MHAGDSHFAAFQRLTKHFQHVSAELRQLIEKQNAMMRQRHFARARNGPAPDQRLGCRRMVGRPHRPLVHQRNAIGQQSQRGVNARGFQRFASTQRRQDPRNPLGEHRLARPRRANHQQIVAARRRNDDGAFDGFLSPHIDKIQRRRDLRSLIRLAIELILLKRELLVQE